MNVSLRHPTEADHARIVRVVDEWWGGRHVRAILPRLWFQHFTATSWVAEIDDGRLAGFLVGFVSPDRPDEGYVHMVATNPNLRRLGVGRRLYQRFMDDVRGRGVRRVLAITWPGDRASLSFHHALGFRTFDGPGTRLIYGVPAFPDYEFDDEDRSLLVRDLDEPG